jgi:tetratricopeptide (TPR) repeat protein
MPLICIDDADALHPTANPVHVALIQLWESLRPIASLIVIGQRLIMDTEQYIPLRGLSMEGATALFAQNQIDVSLKDIRLYHAWTQGNPRLLNLCCSILSVTPDEALSLRASSSAPTLDFLLSRIVTHFSKEERALLAELSVFRRPAPLNLLRSQKKISSLKGLKDRQIVGTSADGGVELMDIHRRFVYRRLSMEAKQALHQQAANVRSVYGEYSSAVYHLIQAGQLEDAVYLWQTVARQELEQGQASGNLAVFRDVLQKESMDLEVKDALHLFCSELERFLGDIEQAGKDIDSISQTVPFFTIAGLEMKGKIANDRNEYAQAKQSFELALERSNIFLEARVAQIHKGKAWMHLRQRDFDQVETELTIAQFEIENMRGNLAFDQCRYDDAATHYTKALNLARDIDSRDAIAKTSHNLAAVYMIRGEFKACLEFLDQVYRHYELMNRTAAMAGCRITTAVAYNLAGDNKSALDSLKEAEQHLSTLDEVTPWQQALIEQAKAEAFLGLSDWAEASVHAKRAISAGDLGVLPDAHRTYGEVLTNQKRWREAEEHLLKSISLASQNEDILLFAYGQRALGRLYLVQRQCSAAYQALTEAVSLFQSIHLPNEAHSCEQLLSEFFRRK